MKARVIGKREHTAAWQSSAGAAPATTESPAPGDCTSVKAGPCNHAGGLKASGVRPQTSCTTSSST